MRACDDELGLTWQVLGGRRSGSGVLFARSVRVVQHIDLRALSVRPTALAPRLARLDSLNVICQCVEPHACLVHVFSLNNLYNICQHTQDVQRSWTRANMPSVLHKKKNRLHRRNSSTPFDICVGHFPGQNRLDFCIGWCCCYFVALKCQSKNITTDRPHI